MLADKQSGHIKQLDYLLGRLEAYSQREKGEYMQNIALAEMKRISRKLKEQFNEQQQEIIDQEAEHRYFLRKLRNIGDLPIMIETIDLKLEQS